MKLTLVSSEPARSLERRWMLADTPLVHDFLRRDQLFAASDLRIHHRLLGTGEETWSVRAFPADGARYAASWMSSYVGAPTLPEWIEPRAAAVRADLLANRAGADQQASDSWTHSLDTSWTVEGADPVPDQDRAFSFMPGRVDVACWVTPGGAENQSRYRIDLTPKDFRAPGRQLWTGTEADITDGGRRMADMPGWIAAILTDQYAKLGSEAREAAAARAA